MAKVSLLVAAYNVEAYIDEALHSAINQTLQDIEIIVVDDGSTDNTREIIQNYVSFDERIHLIIHEENKGLMLARKTAYKHATGEYIMFLDGDDSLEPDACEKAYTAIKKDKVDVLQFEANTFGEMRTVEEQAVLTANLNKYMAPLEGKILSRSRAGLLGNPRSKNINFTIWNKLYKKEIADKVYEYIPEQHIIIAEDVLFSYLASFFSRSYSCIKEKLYNYRLGSGITTTSTVSLKKLKSIAKCLYICHFLEEWTKAQNAGNLLEERLEKTKIQLHKHICYAFLKETLPNQRNAFIQEILQYCSVEEFVSMLTYEVASANTVLPDAYAEICSNLDIFKTTKTSVKTIGTYYFRLRNGGTERVISIITDMWIKCGYNVILFTDEPSSKLDYPLNPSVKRIVLPKSENTLASHQKRVHSFYKALKEHEIDMFVHHAWIDPSLYIDASIIKSMGIPLIIQLHSVFCANLVSPDAYQAYSNSTWHKILQFSDTVLPLTDCDAAYWSSHGLRCIKTINPPTFSLEKTTVSNLSGKNILCVCRLSREKQVLDTIKIFELVIKDVPEATLTIVGDSDDKAYIHHLKGYVKEHNLDQSIRFEGFQPDVEPYYHNADVVCITSKFEGFSLGLSESKIFGIPVVSYNLMNLDTFHPPKGMIVVPQNDISGAADAIIKILSDSDFKNKLGKEARKSAEEMFSQNLSEHWESVFEGTLRPYTDKQYSATDYAIQTLTHYNAIGIKARGNGGSVDTAFDAEEYLNHVRQLEKTVKEIRSSTSYKLGWFLTWPFRKIKDKLKGQKYVE